jgi:hypothetical protein
MVPDRGDELAVRCAAELAGFPGLPAVCRWSALLTLTCARAGAEEECTALCDAAVRGHVYRRRVLTARAAHRRGRQHQPTIWSPGPHASYITATRGGARSLPMPAQSAAGAGLAVTVSGLR